MIVHGINIDEVVKLIPKSGSKTSPKDDKYNMTYRLALLSEMNRVYTLRKFTGYNIDIAEARNDAVKYWMIDGGVQYKNDAKDNRWRFRFKNSTEQKLKEVEDAIASKCLDSQLKYLPNSITYSKIHKINRKKSKELDISLNNFSLSMFKSKTKNKNFSSTEVMTYIEKLIVENNEVDAHGKEVEILEEYINYMLDNTKTVSYELINVLSKLTYKYKDTIKINIGVLSIGAINRYTRKDNNKFLTQNKILNITSSTPISTRSSKPKEKKYHGEEYYIYALFLEMYPEYPKCKELKDWLYKNINLSEHKYKRMDNAIAEVNKRIDSTQRRKQK
jgi:hypothetical protein